MSERYSSKIVPCSVFLVTIGVVGLSVISMIFPALIISGTYEFPNELDPFETSPWALPIIASSIILFVVGFLYKTNNFPITLSNGIKFILNFEISKKTSIIIGIIILSIYIGFSI